MTYNLLLTGPLEPDRIAAALARHFVVLVSDVDVGDADDPGSRNWEAPVSCTYEQLDGDATWALDIYVPDSHSVRPDERQLAAALAEALGQPVLYPAAGIRPSSYWLAAPGSLLTRARIYESDDGRFTIDAVEQSVPQLPGLRVALQPEVIRDYRVATPAADAFAAWLAGRRAASSRSDAERYAENHLYAWESLVVRMSSAWPPDGWYPAEYYREDLEVRDELDAAAAGLPLESAERLAAALADVDAEYRRATVDDGGEALASAAGLSLAKLAQRGWWWRRRPVQRPWNNAVGAE
ncbi:hypothetical protein [Streptomyces sp. NPDC001269]